MPKHLDSIPDNIKPLFQKYYQDNKGWLDKTTYLKDIIKKYLKSRSVILNAGAGINRAHDYRDSNHYTVGIDIDKAVLSNSTLNEAHICDIGHMFFKDESFDVVILDWVLEHLKDPYQAISEIKRVLKCGGTLILRTPNLFHYVYTAGFFIPKFLYPLLLKREAMLGYYRCNTNPRVRKVFERSGLEITHLEMIEGEPSYLAFSPFMFRLGVLYERLVNRFGFLSNFRSCIIAVAKKPNKI